jgi:preprotein translocase subunit SecY
VVALATRQQVSNRPRLLQAALDAFAQPDIRRKLTFTLAILIIFRFIAHVPVPNANREQLDAIFQGNSVLGFLNLFSGGTLQQLSVAALGVYPYVTAQIIIQIMTPLIPSLQALQKEGEQGRNRIQLYSNWLTVPLAAIQAYAQLQLIQQSGGISGIGFGAGQALPTLATIIAMTAGTMLLVWMGELITERGIGNGVSIIIFGGIIAGILRTAGRGVIGGGGGLGTGFSGVLILIILGLVMLIGIVFVQEARRRIPVQYARSQFRRGQLYRQTGSNVIPIPVNSAGMIPLIFAFTGMLLPSVVGYYLEGTGPTWLRDAGHVLRVATQPNSPIYMAAVFLLVVVFAFFYTIVIFQQQNLAENLQKQGGFIPGIRPGRPTAEYLNRVIIRVTWAGALFLGLVSILPMVATRLTNVQALTLSATGMLIVVGVVLDTMRQLEAQLLMRNYEGFIR